MRAIITYHSIDSSGSPVSLSKESFASHAAFLASGRVKVLPLAGIMNAPDDEDAVALTFDDGFRNFASQVLPVLRENAIPATVFVVSDAVGASNAWGGREEPGIPTLPLMDWDELQGVAEAGFEIGAHTRRHPHLTKLSPAQLEDETAGCVDRIRAELGVRASQFSYPYGDVNDSVARVARSMFAHSVTTEHRLLSANEDSALLPRLDAYYFREPGALDEWGSPGFRRRIWMRAQARRVRELVSPQGGRDR
jgi:peptidoglycan/xylan/chitin deacetylase (PgdA/CDA1 family)